MINKKSSSWENNLLKTVESKLLKKLKNKAETA